MSAKSGEIKGQIVQKVRVPITGGEYIEVELNTSKEKISQLTSRMITDDDFRMQFNIAPEKLLEETGIYIKPSDIEKLMMVPITEIVKNSDPQAQNNPVLLALIFIMIIIPGVV